MTTSKSEIHLVVVGMAVALSFFWGANVHAGRTHADDKVKGERTHAHHDAQDGVTFRLTQDEVKAGNITLSFELSASGKSMADTDLEVSHERKLHLLLFDSELQEFRHLHPEHKNGKWTANTTLQSGGKYRVWVQGKTKLAGKDFSISESLSVVGANGAKAETADLNERLSGTDANSKVTLSAISVQAGQPAELKLTITRTDGTSPAITPYLGAKAHVVAVPKDGKTLLHVHPMDHGAANELMLHTVFPSPGSYRVWVEFIDRGKQRVVPLAVKVSPAKG